jgi:hypothetical protein
MALTASKMSARRCQRRRTAIGARWEIGLNPIDLEQRPAANRRVKRMEEGTMRAGSDDG